jgi:hypothetical protein
VDSLLYRSSEDMVDVNPFAGLSFDNGSPRTPKTPNPPDVHDDEDDDGGLGDIEAEFGLGDVGGEYVSPYGENLRGIKDSEAQIKARHMTVGHFENESSTHEEVTGSLFAFLAKKVVEDPLDAKLSKRVAKKWGWFMMATLHLRTADCAEQQLFDEVDMSAFKWPRKKRKEDEQGERGDGDDQSDDDEDDEDDVAESEADLVRTSAVLGLSPFL